jgi:hypothetical protein
MRYIFCDNIPWLGPAPPHAARRGFPAFQRKREGGFPAYPPAWAQPHPQIFPGRISPHFSDDTAGNFVEPLMRGRGVPILPPPHAGRGVPSHPEENGRGVAGLPPSGFRIRSHSRQLIQRLFCKVFRRCGDFCTGFHSRGAGKILSLARGGLPAYLPPMGVGGFLRVRKKTGGGVGRQPPRMIHRFVRYRRLTTGPVLNRLRVRPATTSPAPPHCTRHDQGGKYTSQNPSSFPTTLLFPGSPRVSPSYLTHINMV